jgi:hypothetical protein
MTDESTSSTPSSIDMSELHQSFLEHVQEFKLHEQEDQRRWAQQQRMFAKVTEATEKNAEATARNTEAIGQLAAATKDVVELHRDVVGAARTGKRVQAALTWLLKWGALGTAFAAAVTYFLEKVGGN